jgi:hypothetical protein
MNFALAIWGNNDPDLPTVILKKINLNLVLATHIEVNWILQFNSTYW